MRLIFLCLEALGRTAVLGGDGWAVSAHPVIRNCGRHLLSSCIPNGAVRGGVSDDELCPTLCRLGAKSLWCMCAFCVCMRMCVAVLVGVLVAVLVGVLVVVLVVSGACS